MRVYADLPRGRGAVLRISRDTYQGHELVGIREWWAFTPGDPDTLRPSKSGVNIPVRRLPALLAALHQAEADALHAGHLKPADFHKAGLSVPDTDQKAA
jgi:hypothetical protein